MDIVLRPQLRTDHFIKCGKTKVNKGTNPMINKAAVMCHIARRNGDSLPINNIESPDRAPPPNNTIIPKIIHQGTPLCLDGLIPRNA